MTQQYAACRTSWRCARRSHTLYDVYTAIEDVHTASPPSWSLDLISGLPHLNEEKWRDSLARAVDAEPPHISVYDLQASISLAFCRASATSSSPNHR